jgi:hypothetical protein
MASIKPGTARMPAMQSAKAPTPGSTMRSARRTASASSVTVMAALTPASAAARSKAFAADLRLPEP